MACAQLGSSPLVSTPLGGGLDQRLEWSRRRLAESVARSRPRLRWKAFGMWPPPPSALTHLRRVGPWPLPIGLPPDEVGLSTRPILSNSTPKSTGNRPAHTDLDMTRMNKQSQTRGHASTCRMGLIPFSS